MKRGMRIAFIGAHGTGKTTLVDHLGALLGLPVITERVRIVSREWGYTPATMPDHLLLDFQKEVIIRQAGAERAHQDWGFVSDRSVVDNMAYFLALASRGDWTNDDHAWYRHMVNKRLPYYDMLIYIPPMFALVDDGERHTDPDFQHEIDLSIQALIRKDGLEDRVYQVQTEGVDNRINELSRALMDWSGQGVEA